MKKRPKIWLYKETRECILVNLNIVFVGIVVVIVLIMLFFDVSCKDAISNNVVRDSKNMNKVCESTPPVTHEYIMRGIHDDIPIWHIK